MKNLLFGQGRPGAPARPPRTETTPGFNIHSAPLGAAKRKAGRRGGRMDSDEPEYAKALRRAITELGKPFTLGQVLPLLQRDHPGREVNKWINNAHIGEQITAWREAGLLELIPGEGRKYRTTAQWPGGAHA